MTIPYHFCLLCSALDAPTPSKTNRKPACKRSGTQPKGFHASERALAPTPLNLTENRPRPKHDNPLLTVFRIAQWQKNR